MGYACTKGTKGLPPTTVVKLLKKKKKEEQNHRHGYVNRRIKMSNGKKKKECLTHMQNDYYMFVIRYKGKYT